MTREIKFRAWNREKNKWLEAGQMLLGFVVAWDSQNIFGLKERVTYELSQYTGLKDKNGTEVYEGDIIKCTKGCLHKVMWVEEYGGRYFGGMPAWYLSGLNEGYAWTGSEEVIGNIFENPELLEKENAE